MPLQLNAFIMLDGEAAEAISFYEEALGAQVLFRQSYGEGPQDSAHPLSEKDKKRVAHSVLKINESEIYVADNAPGHPYAKGSLVSICVTADNPDEAGRIFEAMKQGGEVNLPLGPIYFSPAYGILTDKFGVTFQIFSKRKPD